MGTSWRLYSTTSTLTTKNMCWVWRGDFMPGGGQNPGKAEKLLPLSGGEG